MENVWKRVAEHYLTEEKFKEINEEINENHHDVVIKFNMTNLLGGGESEDGVFLSFETDISNAFDVAYRNHEKNIGKDTGSLILDFDNKLSIDSVIKALEILKQGFDNKEDN
ncbi:putative uncharacterized protein [Staphylococcus equorum subsp. equorum Mu2]|uniref:hypothetical protein n=1 Tax=Staphylococcus equorum TaxID=246432 RepID=UPI000267DDCB|nr:hypothetical protein [Staphylococcus equorum]CCI60073.1 putative uncharacterized protein [Staphylococcus equorum subsp. equorum Mu2]